MKLNLEPCDISALWKEVIGMHRAELDRRRIRVSGDLESKPVQAHLDINQIRQVFLNLLRNAIDATPPDGEISAQLLSTGRDIVFKIADTGMGIPAKNLDKIFDLFFTTKPKGTGLGLAICKKIVQDHGGDISIESAEEQGTAVTIKLPHRATPGDAGLLSA
jgi:signal transduction histidine kinase